VRDRTADLQEDDAEWLLLTRPALTSHPREKETDLSLGASLAGIRDGKTECHS